MNKRYDMDEHFEINDELSEAIDDMIYRGIKVVYKYDTNTLVFYKNYGKINEKDIDTIIYRNYNISDIKRYIDEQILGDENNDK